MRKSALVSVALLATALTATAASAQSGRFDSGRHETGRSEAGRPDFGRPDFGRPGPSRSEAGRFDAGRSEAGRFGLGGGATNTPFIDQSQAEQRARIEEGRRNGQLTRSEYNQLMDEQDRIAAMERRAKADGVADPIERQRIRDAQQAASRHIQEETHDSDTRWNRWYRRWW